MSKINCKRTYTDPILQKYYERFVEDIGRDITHSQFTNLYNKLVEDDKNIPTITKEDWEADDVGPIALSVLKSVSNNLENKKIPVKGTPAGDKVALHFKYMKFLNPELHKFVLLKDDSDIVGGEGFIQGTVLIAVDKDFNVEGVTREDVLNASRNAGFVENDKIYGFYTELTTDGKLKDQQFYKRNHEQRINIMANKLLASNPDGDIEEFKKQAKEHYITTGKEVLKYKNDAEKGSLIELEITNKSEGVHSKNKVTLRKGLGSITNGNFRSLDFNSNGVGIVEVNDTNGNHKIPAFPTELSKKEKKFIVDNAFKNGKLNLDILPILSLIFGNNPNKTDGTKVPKISYFENEFKHLSLDRNDEKFLFYFKPNTLISKKQQQNFITYIENAKFRNLNNTIVQFYRSNPEGSFNTFYENLKYINDTNYSFDLFGLFLDTQGYNISDNLEEYILDNTIVSEPNEYSDGTKTYTPVSQYVNYIHTKTHNGVSDNLDIIAEIVDNLAKDVPIKEGNINVYSPSSNIITLKKNVLNSLNTPLSKAIKAEEQIHALTVQWIMDNKGSDQYNELKKIIKFIKTEKDNLEGFIQDYHRSIGENPIQKDKGRTKLEYIIKEEEVVAIAELIARGITDPATIYAFKQIKKEDTSLYDSIKDIVERILEFVGIRNPKNLYETIMAHTFSIIEDSKNEFNSDINELNNTIDELGIDFGSFDGSPKYSQRDIINSLDALTARGLLYNAKDPSKFNPEAAFTQEVRDKLLKFFIGVQRTPEHDLKRLNNPPSKEVIDFLKNISEKDIKDWVNNEDSVFQFKGGDLDTILEEDSVLQLEEEPTVDYSSERGTSQSPTERVNQRARKFLSLLPRMKDGEKETSVTGISLFESANVISAKITKDLAGSLDYPSMVDKVKQLAQTDFQYEILYNMFGLDTDNELGIGLFQSLGGLQKLPMLKVMDQDIKYVTLDIGDNKQGIKTKWLTQFRELVIGSNEIAYIDENNKTFININFLEKELDKLKDKSDLAQTIGILKLFGIELNKKTIQEIAKDNITVNALQFKGVLIDQKDNIKNGFLESDNPWKTLLSSKFNKILDVESVYSEMKTSIMGYNTKGDRVGVYSLSNYALTLRSALEGRSVYNEISDIIVRNISDPTLPKHLREKLLSGDLKIEIFNLDGYATETDRESTSSLSNHQYIKQQKIYWDKTRTMEFPRTETGSSAWGFRFVNKNGSLPEFDKGGTLYVKGDEEQRLNQTVEVFSDILRSAVEKNNILRENYPNGIPFKGYSTFKNFGYLSPELLIKLDKYTLSEFDKALNGAPITEEEFMNNSSMDVKKLRLERMSATNIHKQIKQYIQKTLDTEIKIFGEKGIEISDKELPSYEKYVLNTLIHQTYSNLMFYGDGNWFGKFFKRAKLAVSTGTQTDPVLFERSVNEAASIFGDVEANPFVKVAAFKDIYKDYDNENLRNILNEAISSLNKFIGGLDVVEGEELVIEVEKKVNNKVKIVKEINPNYFSTTNPKMNPFVMNTLTSILDGYQEVNVADGQSFISMDLAKSMLSQRDLWTSQGLDKLYTHRIGVLEAIKAMKDRGIYTDNKYIFIEHKWSDLLGLGFTQEQVDILSEVPKGNWQSYKWQGFGNIKEYADINPIVALKSSFAVMDPLDVIGTKMEDKMFEALKNNVDILTFESAMKGAIATEGPTSISNFSDPLNTNTVFNLPATFFREQLKSNSKVKDTNLLASQIKKLLFSDTSGEGEIAELRQKYLDTLDSIAKANDNILKEKLGLTKDKDGVLKITNPSKVIDTLIRELKDRPDSIEVRQQIKFLENYDPGVSMDYSPILSTLSSILNGLIRKHTSKTKLPGNTLILKSSAFTGKDNIFGLNFYGYNENSIIKAEAKIAMQGTFKNLLKRKDVKERATELGYTNPNKEQLRIALNSLMKEDKWRKDNEQLITIFGYRIPTSGINLMDSYTIKEFLSESLGSTIIVPPESVVKAGEDFDIDKKSFFFPSFDDNGELLSKPKKLTEEERFSKIEEVSKELAEYDIEFIKELKEDKNIINSEIGDYLNILSEIVDSYKKLDEIQNTINSFPDLVEERKEIINLIKDKKTQQEGFEKLEEFRLLNPFFESYINVQKDIVSAIPKNSKEQFEVLNNIKNSKLEIRKELSEAIQGYYNLGKKLNDLKNYNENVIAYETNKLIGISSEAILKPDRYFSLITPVSVEFLKDKFETWQKNKGINTNPIPSYMNVNPSVQGKKREEMVLSGQKMTGIAALGSVFYQLMNKVDFRLNQTITLNTDLGDPKKIYSHELRFPMLSEEETSNLKKDSTWKFSSLYTLDNILKSELFNQSVQGTLDAATEALFAKVNINFDKFPVFQFLVNIVGHRVDNNLLNFLNSKAVTDRQNYLEKGYTSNEAYIAQFSKEAPEFVKTTENGVSYINWKEVHEAVKNDSLKGKPYNFYSGNIDLSEKDSVFVFGANSVGGHGGGAAGLAFKSNPSNSYNVPLNKVGDYAVYGKVGLMEGSKGMSYGLVTKKATINNGNLKISSKKSVSKEDIITNIKMLYGAAGMHPNKKFKIAYRNTDKASYNGYTGFEMIEMFKEAGKIPDNIYFSEEWVNSGKLGKLNSVSKPNYVNNLILYREYQNAAEQIRALQTVTNFDTNPDKSALDAQVRIAEINALIKSGNIPAEVIKNIIRNTELSPYENSKQVKEINQSFTPVLSNQEFLNKAVAIERNELRYANKNKKVIFRIKVVNQLKEWILKTKGTYKGQPIKDYYLKRENDKYTGISQNIWNRIKDLPDSYFNLKSYLSLTKTMGDTGQQLIAIQPYIKFAELDGELREELIRLKEEGNPLYMDLLITSLMQYGYDNTPFSFNYLFDIQDSFDLVKDIDMTTDYEAFFNDFLTNSDNEKWLSGKGREEGHPKYIGQVVKKDTTLKMLNSFGVLNKPNTGLTVEKANEFIDILKPLIKSQAYTENKAASANKMFSVGLRWSRINSPGPSNSTAKQLLNNKEIQTFGKKPNRIKINQKEDGTYGYFTHDQNGKKLPEMSVLNPIIKFIEKNTNIDLSNYDAMLANIYEQGSFIHQHRDTTESKTADKYPVVVLNLGADGELIYDKNFNSSYAEFEGTNSLPLNNGGIYAFGVNGKNRFKFHHRIGSKLKSKNPLQPITLHDGTILKDYRITLTFRRAKDLDSSTPVNPISKSFSKDNNTSSIDIWSTTKNGFESLSNLYKRPFIYNEKKYLSVEHAYQSLKSGKFDLSTYNKYTEDKFDVSGKGPKITGKSAKTKDNYNIDLMENLMRQSFVENPESLKLLKSTGNTKLTHTKDKGVWATKFPEILESIRSSNDIGIEITEGRIKTVYPSKVNLPATDYDISSSFLLTLSKIKFNPNNVIEYNISTNYHEEIGKLYGKAAEEYVQETSSEITKEEGLFLKNNNFDSENFIESFLKSKEGEGLTMQEYAKLLLENNAKEIDTFQLNIFNDAVPDTLKTKINFSKVGAMDDVSNEELKRQVNPNYVESGLSNEEMLAIMNDPDNEAGLEQDYKKIMDEAEFTAEDIEGMKGDNKMPDLGSFEPAVADEKFSPEQLSKDIRKEYYNELDLTDNYQSSLNKATNMSEFFTAIYIDKNGNRVGLYHTDNTDFGSLGKTVSEAGFSLLKDADLTDRLGYKYDFNTDDENTMFIIKDKNESEVFRIEYKETGEGIEVIESVSSIPQRGYGRFAYHKLQELTNMLILENKQVSEEGSIFRSKLMEDLGIDNNKLNKFKDCI